MLTKGRRATAEMCIAELDKLTARLPSKLQRPGACSYKDAYGKTCIVGLAIGEEAAACAAGSINRSAVGLFGEEVLDQIGLTLPELGELQALFDGGNCACLRSRLVRIRELPISAD